MTKHTIRQELQVILGFVAILWAIYFLDRLLPVQFTSWGLIPRTLQGVVGIFTMPFLHGSLGHLIGNTIPLIVLLSLMAGSRANSTATILSIAILGGGLLWFIGRNSIHVGASGLIYGLITFLLLAGYLEKRLVSILVALVVFFLYGSTLIFGVLPTAGVFVSWDGHLAGAIAGCLVALFETKQLKGKGIAVAQRQTP